MNEENPKESPTQTKVAPRNVPARPRPFWKNVLFTIIIVTAFFGLLELILAAIGVRSVLVTEDPFVGFAEKIPLFVEERQPDGSVLLKTAQNGPEQMDLVQSGSGLSQGQVGEQLPDLLHGGIDDLRSSLFDKEQIITHFRLNLIRMVEIARESGAAGNFRRKAASTRRWPLIAGRFKSTIVTPASITGSDRFSLK